jgi:hypothetical protein
MASRIVYNCRPIPCAAYSAKDFTGAGFPPVLQPYCDRTIAPRAPAAETLKKSRLDCFAFIVLIINRLYKCLLKILHSDSENKYNTIPLKTKDKSKKTKDKSKKTKDKSEKGKGKNEVNGENLQRLKMLLQPQSGDISVERR